MKNEDPSWKTPTVVKSNSLIQAGYRLSLAEQRVLLSAIAQVGKDDKPTDQTTYSVEVSALSDIGNLERRRAWEQLRDSAIRLKRREVRIEKGPNGEEQPKKEKRRVLITGWVQSIELVEGEGRVELRFSHDILPYLSLLQREFTSYSLRHVATMRSTHGIRLYELLQQWRQKGEREIELGELRQMFGVADMYPNIRDLKRRVIEPAVADVNECSDLTVSWGQRKAGRRVVAIQFAFEPKDAKKRIEKRVQGSDSKPGRQPTSHAGPQFDWQAHEESRQQANTQEAKDAAKKALAKLKQQQTSDE